MVIVDTSVLIDYLDNRVNSQTNWLDRQIGLQRMGITSLIQAEILKGIRVEGRFLQTLEVLDQFHIFEIGSSVLAVASARNYRTLRSKGFTIRNTIDSLIATFCIGERHLLLHNDRDFDPFEAHLGLQVMHPVEPLLH
jgi:predicted nucleic acid-binding protein